MNCYFNEHFFWVNQTTSSEFTHYHFYGGLFEHK